MLDFGTISQNYNISFIGTFVLLHQFEIASYMYVTFAKTELVSGFGLYFASQKKKK